MRMQNDPATVLKRSALAISIIALLLAFGLGYATGQWRGQKKALGQAQNALDAEVEVIKKNWLRTETRKIIAGTVQGLKSESKITSYSYRGLSKVSFKREYLPLIEGKQELLAAYTASYFVDFKQGELKAQYDETRQQVTVHLPALQYKIDLDPKASSTSNSGLLTLSDGTVQDFTQINYDTALGEAKRQAQNPELVKLAQNAMRANIERLFRLPLAAVGHEDLQVQVLFPSEK